jgi:hypothetical protein
MAILMNGLNKAALYQVLGIVPSLLFWETEAWSQLYYQHLHAPDDNIPFSGWLLHTQAILQ